MVQIELFAEHFDGEIGQSDEASRQNGKKRARARGFPSGWRLEDHVCRTCFGRLVSTLLASGRTLYRCSNCGAEADGHCPDVLCACGMKLRAPAPSTAVVDAGLRCQVNPAPTAAFPSQIVASEARS